jgi:iron complex outermembrane receptor protein
LNTPTVTQDDLTNLSLEELMKIQVVYAASKHEQKLGEAPSSITIITGDDIRKYGYRTLADILQSVRGFYVTYDRDYDYVGVRGFGRPGDYNTRVLLLVDGVRVNENVYDMAPIGTDFPMDIDLIERVEIIRGPSSSLYGTNAFFGVINVVTKPCPDLTGFQAQGGAGSHGAYKGRCSYGHEFSNGVELFLSGSGFTEQGQDLNFHEFNDPMIHNGIAEGCDGSKYQDYLVKSSYRGFNVLAGFSTREKHVPTGAWGTVLNDPRTRTIDERGFLAVEFQRTIRPEMELLNRVCFQNYHYDGYYVFDYAEAGAPPELMVNIDRANGQWWGGESALNWNVTRKHHFTLGTEIRYNTRIDQVNYDEGSNIYYLDDHQNSTIWALFGEDEFHLRKELILNAGVRYDNYETFGGATNPRLGVIYSPFKATNFKLLYGAAFRAPNAYELYYNDGGNSQKGNPDLSPERIQTYEAIWEQYFGEHFRSEMSVYRYTIRDLISLTIDPTDELLVFRNVDRIDANGVEMELEYKSDNGFAGRMSQPNHWRGTN